MEEHTKFTEPAVWNNYPHVSPDGQKVVFMSSRHDGDQEIYSIEIKTGQTQRLTQYNGRDFRPTWPPNGQRIAFVSQRQGNLDVYVMNADGTGVRRITTNEGLDDYPSWHPNGKSLVYACEHNGRYDIFAIDVD